MRSTQTGVFSEISLLLIFNRFAQTGNVVDKDLDSRFGHFAVGVALKLINVYIGMSRQFEHPPEIGILFISAEHFLFPVA